MKAVYNVDAPKRPVNLSLNEDLVARARSLSGNLSAEVESLLSEFVLREMQRRQVEIDRRKRSAATWNDFTGQHGSFSDEFSTL